MLISPRRGVRALTAMALVGTFSIPLGSWAAGDGWQTRSSGPCTVQFREGSSLASDVLQLCVTAVPRVGALVRAGWTHRVVVVVPRDAAELLALAPEAGNVTSVAAVATRDRVVLNPTEYAGLSEVGRQVVLTHEVTHLALRSVTTARTPLWLVEGIAEHIGLAASGLSAADAAQELAQEVRDGKVPSVLPTNQDFDLAPAQAYGQAWLAVDLLAREYGGPALLAFYSSVGAHDLDAAFARLGTSTAAFTAAWRADLRRRLA